MKGSLKKPRKKEKSLRGQFENFQLFTKHCKAFHGNFDYLFTCFCLIFYFYWALQSVWQWGGWQQAGTDDLYLPGQQPPCQQIISGKSNSITGPRLPKRAAESKAEPQPTSLNKLFPIAWKSHTWNISITSTKVKLGGFLIVCYIHLMSQNTPLRKRCLLHPDPVSPRLTYTQARRKGSSLNYILAGPSVTFIDPCVLRLILVLAS